jgi:hypothetical protein
MAGQGLTVIRKKPDLCIRHTESTESAGYDGASWNSFSAVRGIARKGSGPVQPMLILMFKKRASLIMGLAIMAAIGGPIAWFSYFAPGKSPVPANGQQPAGTQGSIFAAAVPPDSGANGVTANILAPQVPGDPAPAKSGVRVQNASTVFDFQITPEWIVAHWPTVSTGLAQLQLEGYRVPLVTGTGPQDPAGSLTYYFNPEQKLQQITFVGTAIDPRALIGLLCERFHLTRRLANDPGLIVYESVHSNNALASSLRLRLAAQPQPTELYRRYDIELSLVRPSE